MSTRTTSGTSSAVADFDAITQVLATLLEGESGGDVAKLKAVFHPDARMFGQIEGQRCDMPISAYFDLAASAPANSEGNYQARVLSVQQTGDAAMAVVVEENCWGSASFIDYLALARVAGAWKIVNKTFAHTGGRVPMPG
jgi:hypothetical protein